MKNQKIVIILAVAVLHIISASEISPNEESHFSLFNAMARSADPLPSTKCFNYYIPLIQKIVETYQKNYGACLEKSQDDRSRANDATLANRLALAANANSSCDLLRACHEIPSPDHIFECYTAAGSKNIRTMYEINLNSSEYLTNLQEDFRLIEVKEYKCTNETKHTYEIESAGAYEDFNKCNLGLIEPPTSTEAPATTEVTETTKTTEDFTETTAEPTKIPEAFENADDIPAPRRLKKMQTNKKKH